MTALKIEPIIMHFRDKKYSKTNFMLKSISKLNHHEKNSIIGFTILLDTQLIPEFTALFLIFKTFILLNFYLLVPA